MSLEVQPLDSRLKLKYEIGLDDEGRPKHSTRSYSGIKAAAADQDVFDVAVAFAGLQEYPLVVINRVNEVELLDL